VDPLQLLVLLTVAGICGAVAQLAVAFDTRGMVTVLVSIVVGIVGIFISRGISALITIQIIPVRVGTQRFDVLWTILGAMLVLFVLKLLRSGGRSLLRRST
jgi:uncharacterized membrane protein YeaQ/YmgE (transglycosylase-associated protein family)